jgi:hypothetical protein
MRAQLRLLFSPDADPLQDYAPEDPERFGIFVQAMIGPEGTEDAESFDFMVCSPNWLQNELRERGAIFGHGYLFLDRYAYRALLGTFTTFCQGIEGPDWPTIGARLNRYGRWEFEDYVSHDPDRAARDSE